MSRIISKPYILARAPSWKELLANAAIASRFLTVFDQKRRTEFFASKSGCKLEDLIEFSRKSTHPRNPKEFSAFVQKIVYPTVVSPSKEELRNWLKVKNLINLELPQHVWVSSLLKFAPKKSLKWNSFVLPYKLETFKPELSWKEVFDFLIEEITEEGTSPDIEPMAFRNTSSRVKG